MVSCRRRLLSPNFADFAPPSATGAPRTESSTGHSAYWPNTRCRQVPPKSLLFSSAARVGNLLTFVKISRLSG